MGTYAEGQAVAAAAVGLEVGSLERTGRRYSRADWVDSVSGIRVGDQRLLVVVQTWDPAVSRTSRRAR